MRPVKLRIDDTTQARWQALTETAKLPLQQSWTYGAAVDAAGGQALRIEVREKDRHRLGSGRVPAPWLARYVDNPGASMDRQS